MYNFIKIEKKWQDYWEKNKTFKVDIWDFSKPKFYVLDMFPYPSGVGLHAGHPEGYTATDIVARMKRMQGYNVLHPIGYDSFGLPAEQYAIQTGTKLKIVTKPAQSGYYGFAVMKGKNQELLHKFDDGLAKLKKNGGYDKIVNRYINQNTIAEQKKANENSNNEHTFIGLLKQNSGVFLNGLWKTIYLTILGIIGATIFGIIIGFLGVIPNKFAQGVSTTVIYIFRGLPLLVLALFIYNGIPSLTGTKIPAFIAGIITLTLNEGAYTAAFVKGGIEAVDKGQMEAARSLGLSFGKAMKKIILPQGIKIMVPSFVNQFIITLKDTSILSIIGILELTQTGKIIIARNLEGFKVWAIIGLMYLIVITVLTWISNYLQKKMNN